MSQSVAPNQCPNCEKFILGEYCYTCKKNINEDLALEKDLFKNGKDFSDFFKDIFNSN